MQLHEIKPPRGSRKRRKIVGRGPGSDHGKTSCRGQKGQQSRSSVRLLISLEGGQMPLIRRLPKVGFRSKRPILNQLVSVESLNRFEKGTVIDINLLKSSGLIKSLNKPYKILGNGELKKALTIQGCNVSASAKEKIIKAGGTVEELPKTASSSKS